MFSLFLIISYLAAFLSLSLWFYFKHNDQVRPLMGNGFLLSLAAYLGISLLVPGVVSWMSLSGHIALLFLGGFFLNTFSNYRMIFIPMLFLMCVGYFLGMTGWKPWTGENNPFVSSSALDNLDPDNELLVEVSNGHQSSELRNIVEQYNLTLTHAFNPQDGAATDLDDYYAVNIPDDQTENYEDIVSALRNSGLVDHVEPNEILSLDPMEQQTATAEERQQGTYAVNDPDIGNVWGYEAMEVEALYQLIGTQKIKPKKKARVVIIDTGVDGGHEDLSANFVSIKKEYNEDPHGHGTHCAGIAAAVSNNKVGIASFTPTGDFVEVSSVKVFGKYGNTTQRIIIQGMLLAADKGADVLSMSLGGAATSQGIRAYEQAVNYANKKGAIVVVAAGNENIDASKRLPAAVDGVITVSALDKDLSKAVFSNSVNNLKMGIAAPGVDVYSTIPDDQYAFFNGTSMATPYVAGLLGLMKSIQPKLTTQEAYRILKSTGKPTQATRETGPLISPTAAIQTLVKK
jgi:thermitase